MFTAAKFGGSGKMASLTTQCQCPVIAGNEYSQNEEQMAVIVNNGEIYE
jgi:hypothetical protein